MFHEFERRRLKVNIITIIMEVLTIIVLLVFLYCIVTEHIDRRRAKKSAALAVVEMEKQVRLAATKAEKSDA
jgi:uncharacterized membrane protein